MNKIKNQKSKIKITIKNLKILILICNFTFYILHFTLTCFAQDSELELTIDAAAATVPLPKIFKPNIDLSGRGFHRDISWPQTLASKEALAVWKRTIGFDGIYRLQYNLWEISQLSKDEGAQNKLLSNYENIIKEISDSGGIVILDIFGTPAGLGKVLDKKSPPLDFKAFKQSVKSLIRELSCNKRYNIWYEVWNAPDLDDFFLGSKAEYLNLYRAVAEAANELKIETRLHIPVGGPSVSWWFQNSDGNTIITPEKSLIYELIKFCSNYRLPLDFISWHGFSTNPAAEKEETIYKKTAVNLIRDWLTYFNFDRNTPLIIDEWNYDRDANVLPERKNLSFISASYIPSRVKNMYEAGLDYQLYFCLEDFQNNKEGVVRNAGIFSFDPEFKEYKGEAKTAYNALRMLNSLGSELFSSKINDDFVGALATKSDDSIIMLVYNYIDPEIAANYLSKTIASLNGPERKALLSIIKSGKLGEILSSKADLAGLRLSNKVKTLLKKSQELNDKIKKNKAESRHIKINIKNLSRPRPQITKPETAAEPAAQEAFLYLKYTIDYSCGLSCEFVPVEQKEIDGTQEYHERLALAPYSVHMIILKKKPKEPESAYIPEQPAVQEPRKEAVSESAQEPKALPAAQAVKDADKGPDTKEPDTSEATEPSLNNGHMA